MHALELACDICRRKQRFAPDRLGTTARCRECGSSFDISEHNFARDDSRDEESRPANNPWVWIRGSGVALMIAGILIGLGLLPFYEKPVATGQIVPVAQAAAAAAPLPPPITRSDNHAAQPFTVPQPSLDLPAPAIPSAPPRRQSPVFTGGFVPSPTGYGYPPAVSEPPERLPEAPAGVPTMTGWKFVKEGFQYRLELTGTGFSSVTKIILIDVNFLQSWEKQFSRKSDSRLDVTQVQSIQGRTFLVLLAGPGGASVTVPSDLGSSPRRVDGRGRPGPAMYYAGRSSTVVAEPRSIVFVESGGTAELQDPFSLAFVAGGGKLRNDHFLHKVFLAEEAQVTHAHTDRMATVFKQKYPQLTFCRVNSLPSGSW